MSTNSELELSVVVPTRGSGEKLSQLLARFDQQTLAPRRFEVLVVDDGGEVPVHVEPADHRYALKLLRQEGGGLAAARNFALDHAQGGIVLFLEDDSLPAFDLLEKHLSVHAARTDRVAVLGTFAFSADARRRPFVQVLDDSDLLYDFVRLRDGALHPWTYFWTCNLSVQLATLREVGGFDAAAFPQGVCDDLELGLRLAERGVGVLHRKDLVCEHDHPFTVDEFFERSMLRGIYSARLANLYGRSPTYRREPFEGRQGDTRALRDAVASAVSLAEGYHTPAREFRERLRLMESGSKGEPLSQLLLSELRSMTRRLALAPFSRGQLIELAEFDPEGVLLRGPTRGRLTTVIVTTRDQRGSLEACLERLRASREAAHPIEVLVVDDGSSDGTVQFLSPQADVTCLALSPAGSAPLGPAAAHNRGLAAAHGEHVVFLDVDARVTPGWLGRLLYHAEVDPGAGCVAPRADLGPRDQRIGPSNLAEFVPGPDAAAGLSQRLWRESSRRHGRLPLLAGGCLLVPRRVLNAIGGLDERFSPCGRGSEDFILRASLAGFRNRLAFDVFVQRDEAGQQPRAADPAEQQRRWEECFAAKWGLARPVELEAGEDEDRTLQPLRTRIWSQGELQIPIRSSEHHPALLPRPSEAERPGRRP